jgi:hypothetical protein
MRNTKKRDNAHPYFLITSYLSTPYLPPSLSQSPSMLKPLQSTSRLLLRPATKPSIRAFPKRTFHHTPAVSAKMDAYKKAGNSADAPPKHEMVHFPGLMSEKRSFGDFRTVLHTGLYSQIVAMEVPVGGEIGDEVHISPDIPLLSEHEDASPGADLVGLCIGPYGRSDSAVHVRARPRNRCR